MRRVSWRMCAVACNFPACVYASCSFISLPFTYEKNWTWKKKRKSTRHLFSHARRENTAAAVSSPSACSDPQRAHGVALYNWALKTSHQQRTPVSNQPPQTKDPQFRVPEPYSRSLSFESAHGGSSSRGAQVANRRRPLAAVRGPRPQLAALWPEAQLRLRLHQGRRSFRFSLTAEA
jgi:hypothetical protein